MSIDELRILTSLQHFGDMKWESERRPWWSSEYHISSIAIAAVYIDPYGPAPISEQPLAQDRWMGYDLSDHIDATAQFLNLAGYQEKIATSVGFLWQRLEGPSAYASGGQPPPVDGCLGLLWHTKTSMKVAGTCTHQPTGVTNIS